MMEEVVANYSAAGIPLDTMWFDIDHMVSSCVAQGAVKLAHPYVAVTRPASNSSARLGCLSPGLPVSEAFGTLPVLACT